MKNYLRNLLAMLFVFIFISTVSAKESFSAPDFKLQDTNGGLVMLSSYKGKQPIILFFWTTWCPYCRRE